MSASTSAVQQLITSTAQAYGVSPALALAVAQQESGFNQSAVGSSGEIGVFQLMPGTAAGLGVDPANLQQNVQGGVAYLAQLLSQFGGNTALALAAYNAGPGAASSGNIPASTQSYVSSVLANAGGSPVSDVSSDSTALADASSSPGDLDLTDPTTLLVLAGVGVLAWWMFSS